MRVLAAALIAALVFLSLPVTHAAPAIAVTVVTTSQRATLAYTAPNTSPCRVRISESPSLTPLHPDVDPALFSGSDQDNRAGSLGAGTTSRTFVFGTVPREGKVYDNLAADGKRYGRSGTPSTTYYYQVDNCGASGEVGSGSFTLTNIPAGNTYARSRGVGADGNPPYPTLDSDRTTARTRTHIDPSTGLKVKQLTAPGDFPSDAVENAAFTSASGSGWTSPSNVLADDANSATYSAGMGDWLYVAAPNLNINTAYLRVMKLRVKGSADGMGDNAKLEICLTNDGATCISDIQEITLSATPNTTICYPNSNCSTPNGINTWRNPPLTKEELTAGSLGSFVISGWGVLMRKKGTGSGTVTLQFANFDWITDVTPGAADNGAQQAALHKAGQTINDSSGNAGWLWVSKNQGISTTLHWIPVNPALNSRFLGYMRMVGEATMPNVYISSNTATFKDTDPRKYYFVANDNSGNQVLVEATLPASGNSYYDSDASPGSLWSATYTNLTVAPNHLTKLIADVDATFTGSFACSESTVQRGRVIVKCRRGFQDSYGYIAVYNLTTGLIERVKRTWDDSLTRWCGYHTEEPTLPESRQYQWTTSELNKGGTAAGPFQITLNGSVDASQTNFTVTSTHSTPGEPVEASAPTELTTKAVNDLIMFDSEVVRITAITSATQFTVERGYGPSNPASHGNGTVGTMLCGATDWAADGSRGAAMFLNLEDGTAIKDNSAITSGHGSTGWQEDLGIGYRVQAGQSIGTLTSDANPVPTPIQGVTVSPAFAGIAPTIDPNDHQFHPFASHQVAAASDQRNWGMDIAAQISHPGFNLTSPVHQTGAVWKFTKSGSWNRKLLPTHFSFGVKVGTDISSTATGNVIDAAADYSYCEARAVNECRTGSSVGDIYFKAPTFAPHAISGATNASPIVITTSVPHGYFQSGQVVIAGVGGNTAANGTWTMVPLTPYTFSLTGSSGNGTYTSGGTSLRTPSCFSGGESITLAYPHQEDEVCAGDRPTYSQQLFQFRLDRNDTTGRNGRQLGFTFSPPHRREATSSPKISPDGKWAIVSANISYGWGRTTENLMWLLPPFPADDAITRTTFVQRSQSLAGPGTATTAIVEFGLTPDLYCTSRDEVCVSAANNNPWFYASESFTRVSCPGGVCSINVPVIPDWIAFWRAKFYDSGGNLVSTTAIQTVTDGTAQAGGAAGTTHCHWHTNPRCQEQ